MPDVTDGQRLGPAGACPRPGSTVGTLQGARSLRSWAIGPTTVCNSSRVAINLAEATSAAVIATDSDGRISIFSTPVTRQHFPQQADSRVASGRALDR
jgi:hypothetical protein